MPRCLLPRPPPGSASSSGVASAGLFRLRQEPTSQACEHLAGLPPPWARASDAGETRARCAGPRPRFLSKCLRPGFLLTEGRLQLASDSLGGGSQGPQPPGTSSWHQAQELRCAHAAVRLSRGRWGQASRALKGIPRGGEEAVNPSRNSGAQACSLSRAASQSKPRMHLTLQSDRPPLLTLLWPTSLATCTPGPCIPLWVSSPASLWPRWTGEQGSSTPIIAPALTPGAGGI